MGKRRKKYRLKKRFWILLSCVSMLLVLSIILLLRGCKEQETEPPPESIAPSDMTLLAIGTAATDYWGKTVFIGDSRTVGLLTYKAAAANQILAKDSLNHKDARQEAFVDLGDGKMITLAKAVGTLKPKRMVVSFGINGMEFMEEKDFMNEYKSLIIDLLKQSPDSSIIVQSIYPVSTEIDKNESKISNKNIDNYNQKLLELCKQQKYYYLNTAEMLKNSDGALDQQYDAGDGIHLNQRAYIAIKKYVTEHPVV